MRFFQHTMLVLASVLAFGSIDAPAQDRTLEVLHHFSPLANGGSPAAALLLGSAGNLYWTTGAGGSHARGTVFKLDSGGTITILCSFGKSDGSYPNGVLTEGPNGQFLGTTVEGGA